MIVPNGSASIFSFQRLACQDTLSFSAISIQAEWHNIVQINCRILKNFVYQSLGLDGNQKVETRTKFVRCGFPNMAKKRQERDGF